MSFTAPTNLGAGSPASSKHDRRGIRLAENLSAPTLPAPAQMPINLPLDAIRVDASVQMRERMDTALIGEYAETIAGWIAAAPLVAFADTDGRHLLADGFHRIEAARQAGLESVLVVVKQGTRADALRFAIGANHGHGARRTAGDMDKAFSTAVAENLVDPTDTAAVAVLLKCSERQARRLTAEAREQAKAARDAEIARLADEGKSQREISAETGIPRETIRDVVGRKRPLSEFAHSAPVSPPSPPPADPAAPARPALEARREPPASAPPRPLPPATAPAKAQPAPDPEPLPGAKEVAALQYDLGLFLAETQNLARRAMHARSVARDALSLALALREQMVELDVGIVIRNCRETIERLEGQGHG